MDLILSILSGGATGLIGTAVSTVSRFFTARQELKAKEAGWAHELSLHGLNIKARGREMEHEALISAAETERSIRSESYRHDTGIGQGGPILTFILRMVRPALTFLLIGLVAWFWLDLDPNDKMIDAHALKTKIVDTVVYLTTAAVTWWFGSRDMQHIKKR